LDDRIPPPITLRDIVRILGRRYKIALLTFVVVLAAAWAFTTHMPTTYMATTRVLLDSPSSNAPGNILDLLSNQSGGSSLDVEIEKIKSRRFLAEVIQKAHLKNTNPESLGGRLKLAPGAGGQILEIIARAENGDEAARIANTTANVYMEAARQDADRKADIAKRRLREARDRAFTEKAKADADVFAFNKRYIGNADPATYFTRRAAKAFDVKSALEDARKDLPVQEARRDAYVSQLQTIPPTLITGYSLNKNTLIDSFKAEIKTLGVEKKVKLEDFGPDSDEVRDVNRRISARQEALQEVRDEKGEYSIGSKGVARNPDYSSAETQRLQTELSIRNTRKVITATERQYADLEAEQRRLGPLKTQYETLVSLQNGKNDAYRKANLGLFQIDQNQITNVPNLRILDAARVPPEPVSPKPLLNGLMAVALGLFLGVGMAILAEYLAETGGSHAPGDGLVGLPQVGGVPLLASGVPVALPASAVAGGSSALAPVSGNSAAAEDAIREVGYNFLHPRQKGAYAVPVVLLTGTRSDESTAAVAAQLCATLVRDGLRVTLVDADRVQPRLNHVFGAPDAPGLADALAGRSKATDILHVGAGGGLRFLAAGSPDDASPVTEAGLRSVFKELARASDTDLVLISGPSVWAARTVAPLEKAADGMALVAPPDAPPGESVARARRLLTNGYQPRILGVVVGGAPVAAVVPVAVAGVPPTKTE